MLHDDHRLVGDILVEVEDAHRAVEVALLREEVAARVLHVPVQQHAEDRDAANRAQPAGEEQRLTVHPRARAASRPQPPHIARTRGEHEHRREAEHQVVLPVAIEDQRRHQRDEHAAERSAHGDHQVEGGQMPRAGSQAHELAVHRETGHKERERVEEHLPQHLEVHLVHHVHARGER